MGLNRLSYGTPVSPLSGKQDKLHGEPGQVVGFDGMGLACAVRGWSNPNLLHNRYFADPVNQRGQSEYTGGGYTIDRWKLLCGGNTGKVFVSEGCVTIENTGANEIGFAQLCDEQLGGDTQFTFSCMVKEGTGRLLLRDDAYTDYSPPAPFDGPGLYSCTGIIPRTGHYIMPEILVKGGERCSLIAAKLELGDRQTLAHQDGEGNWVLNDPPPDNALELVKCQRYYRLIKFGGAESFFAPTKIVYCSVCLDRPMRAAPVCENPEAVQYAGSNGTGTRLNDGKLTITAQPDRISFACQLPADTSYPASEVRLVCVGAVRLSADL